jgi:hypothetical protein
MKPRIHTAFVSEPAEQDIQHTAYLLWEEAGRPADRDQEFWFTAREKLRHTVIVPTQILARPALTKTRDAQPAGRKKR